jgi:mono/diheme cytochrome c family protein/glucose/arabinose dehydrogenase
MRSSLFSRDARKVGKAALFAVLAAVTPWTAPLSGPQAWAAEPPAAAGAGGRAKWDMDYGPLLSLAVQMPGETAGSTPKGVAMRVGEQKEGTLVFDTDLVRCTAGWTGGYLDFKGVAFSGSHGGNPGPVGAVVFRTPVMPGWSKAGSFVDPRPLPKGFGASTIPFGPLPAEWAKYKGVYRHGERMVLSYTVGQASLLEAPGLEGQGEKAVLTRTFQVRSAGESSTLLVAEVAESSKLEERDGCVVLSDSASNAGSRLVLKVVGAPAGARWKWIAPGKLGLELPAFQGGERFKLGHWKGTEATLGAGIAALGSLRAAEDLTELTKPGPALWPETVNVKGELGKEEGPFQLDKVALPVENPWRSWLRVGGVDFFKDGRIAFSTLAGDVWIGSGVDASLEQIRWKRFAAGLYQPLGLKIVEDTIYLTCRDGLVRLIDSNGDGEADFYEAFNNEVQVTPNFHEFMFDLHTDSQGNFYFAKGGPVKGGGRGWDPISEHNGTMMKVSKDGSKFEVFATGFRAPNGIGIGPGDVITTGDNEGTWVPMCYLHIVKKGSFLSVPDLAHREVTPTAFDPHVCFFPKSVDNSSGGQVWVTSDQWGPLKGRLLHMSYGQASLYEVMMEEVDGVVQGGVTKVPLNFATGIMRARFSPKDGQLYVAGQKGWQTSGAEDGAIQRIRYTGKPHYAPNGLRVTDRGIYVSFDEPLDPVTAANPDNFSIEQYNYRWTSNYGSKEYRPSNPNELGRDLVDISGVHLSEDRKTVFLEAAGLKPVMQSEITMRIKAASGAAMPEKLWHTINAVAKESGPRLKLTAVSQSLAPKLAGSGVALTLKAGGKTDVRRDRLVALHVPAGGAVSPILPKGAFEAQWDSVVKVPLSRSVQLMAEGRGEVKVSVNGEKVFEGALSEGGKRLGSKVDLRKGGNLLKVEYKSPAAGEATCRLLWSSSEFAAEPVLPTALYVPEELAAAIEKGAQWREGRQLFAQANCVACHDATGVLAAKGQAPEAMPEYGKLAPVLSEIGARFDQAWLAKWILNPHDFRKGSLMPAVLHGDHAAQDAADIAAFLASQGTAPAELKLEDPGAGSALFANLGCIACHSTPRSKVGNDFGRVSLSHVSSKWKAGALRDYLLDPHKYHANARMPKTPLSEKEALQLTSFLMSFDRSSPAPAATPTGDLTRGAQLFASAGCLQCHAGLPGTAVALQKTLSTGWERGCVAASAEQRGKAPDYQFSKTQREALQAFLKQGVQSVENDSPLEFAQRAVFDLRCVACHQLDARQSVWSSVTEEGNMLGGLKGPPKRDDKKPPQAHPPLTTTSIPQLTWLGEKLQPAWSAKMIAGQVPEKPRHYLFGRMPAFAAHAEVLSKGLSHWHGFGESSSPLVGGGTELASTGEKLIGDQGGFACTVCHDVGKKPATAPFEAPALNLAWAGERLRLSYFERWLLNPQRVDPETKMPKYADGQSKTQLKQVLEGDGLKQFDAIRQYLISIKD